MSAASERCRDFDFWIGSWEVTDAASGEPAGRNLIEPILGGRALREHWRGASGLEGTSLNVYDEARGAWQQTWVSSDGMLLALEGGMRDGAMEMTGDAGDEALHRIRWTPHGDGSVVQRWEASQDAGANWTPLFEGLYRPL